MKTIIAYCFFIGICLYLQAQPNSKKEIENLELNWEQARAMKAKYVLSSVPINLSNIPELSFKKSFTNKQ